MNNDEYNQTGGEFNKPIGETIDKGIEKSKEVVEDISDEIDYIKKTLLLIRTNFNVEFIKKNIFNFRWL